MRIGIIGASGNIGSRIRAEAAGRGHEVTAFTRSGAAARGTAWRDLDIFNLDALRATVTLVDALVSAYHPGNTVRNLGEALQLAIADPAVYARAAANIVKALESRTARRSRPGAVSPPGTAPRHPPQRRPGRGPSASAAQHRASAAWRERAPSWPAPSAPAPRPR